MSYNRRTNYRRSSSGGGWRGPPVMELLKESITMSAAHTPTEIEVALLEEVGKMRFGRVKAMMIHAIEIDLVQETAGAGMDVDATDADHFKFQCTSKSYGITEANLSDKDCLFKIGKRFELAALTWVVDQQLYKEFPQGGIPYFKKRIWFQIDDVANQGQANTYHFQLYYSFKYLNKKQQTRIISQLQ